MSDGIIYGVSYNYGDTGMICEIVRMTTDGTQLPSFSLDNQTLTIHCLADGVLYASVCNVEYSDDDYIQRDLLYAINVSDGSFTLINTSASDLFYYSESEPAIRVSDGRIYMIVDDTEACALSLKSCAADGSDWITLARGISLAIG